MSYRFAPGFPFTWHWLRGVCGLCDYVVEPPAIMAAKPPMRVKPLRGIAPGGKSGSCVGGSDHDRTRIRNVLGDRHQLGKDSQRPCLADVLGRIGNRVRSDSTSSCAGIPRATDAGPSCSPAHPVLEIFSSTKDARFHRPYRNA